MKCGKPYCACVGQCFAKSSPLPDFPHIGCVQHDCGACKKKDAALKLALEALEKAENDMAYHGVVNGDALDAAIAAIKEALK